MAMLLPRGIVENTREIYAEVASYPVVPPEKICQYWNVYTTTFRRLCDPTAYRLENFWWHVWGSDRRHLSGPALARLFEEFSIGPTFVPLRSLGNRYEGPSIPRVSQQSKQEPVQVDSEPTKQTKQEAAQDRSTSNANSKPPTPSSSRPAPPHPILKKSRGPSASGARPTARFVSPPASGDEDDVSSGSTVVSSSGMPPPPPPTVVKRGKATNSKAAPRAEMPPPPVPTSKKEGKAVAPVTKPAESAMRPPPSNQSPGRGEKGSTPTRRIVASTAASKRRPSMPRRQGSQSSASSEASSSSNILRQVGTQRPPSSIVEQPERSSQGSSESSSQASLLLMGSKAAGKRPAKAASRRSAPRGNSTQGDASQEGLSVSHNSSGVPPQRRSTWDIRDMAAASPTVAGFVSDQRIENFPPRVDRSLSLVEAPKRVRVGTVGTSVAQALVGTSVVATTNTTARGRFDSETIPLPPVAPEGRDIPDSVRYSPRSTNPTSLGGQFAPTPPNPAPPIPFGRSMSQLTLLLEREKARKH